MCDDVEAFVEWMKRLTIACGPIQNPARVACRPATGGGTGMTRHDYDAKMSRWSEWIDGHPSGRGPRR